MRELLGRELNEALGHLQELEELRDELQRGFERCRVQSTAALEEYAAFTQELNSLPSGSTEVDTVFDRVVASLARARPRLRQALDQLRRPSALPEWQPDGSLAAFRGASFDGTLQSLRELTTQLSVLRTELQEREAELRWVRVEQEGRHVAGLNELRLVALENLSPRRRQQITSITREGVAQLADEVDLLILGGRFYWEARQHEVAGLEEQLGDVFTLSSVTFGAVKVLLSLAFSLWLLVRWRVLLERLSAQFARSMRSLPWKRRVSRWLEGLERVAHWPLVLVLLFTVRWALGSVAERPLIKLPWTLCALFASYRFAVDLLVHLIERVAQHYRLSLLDQRRDRLVRSVRGLMRVLLLIAVLLVISAQTVGRGCLYNMVQELSWVLVGLTLLWVLVVWRQTLTETFLDLQPTGRLSYLVQTSRERWYGVLLVPASFVWLAGRASMAVARDFAMGFEQTGKLLAFLFRRKVEKQAESRGYAEGDMSQLPTELLEAFSEAEVARGETVVPFFPGLDRFRSDVSAWREGGFAGSFLLTGERGIGKSSWLQQVRRDDVAVVRTCLEQRVATPQDMVAFFARELDLSEVAAGTLEDLAAALCAGPRRLVIVDLAQHLFLAVVGGYASFAAFAELVNRTRRQVYWLCSMNAYAWRHLSAVRDDAAVFRTRVHLSAWGEGEVRELIRRRSEASGLRFNYADLVVNEMEGISYRSSVVQSAESYTRLLWDYSDGNPRAALHFFLRSLEMERPGRVRVRMFRAPEPAALEEGGEVGMFLLAAIVTHESIGLGDLAAVTRYPEQDCHIQLDRLWDLGAISSAGGLYRISTHWHRAVVRLLRRRNYIPD